MLFSANREPAVAYLEISYGFEKKNQSSHSACTLLTVNNAPEKILVAPLNSRVVGGREESGVDKPFFFSYAFVTSRPAGFCVFIRP